MKQRWLGRAIDVGGGLIAGCIAGYALGWFGSVLPPRIRILWLFAIAVGVACGWVASIAVARLDLHRRVATIVFAVAASAVCVQQYAERSVGQFAAAVAASEPESPLTKLFLAQAGDEIGGIPVSPRARWLRWRVSALGAVVSPWPLVIACSEAAACLLAAGITGMYLTRQSGEAAFSTVESNSSPDCVSEASPASE